MAVPREGPHSQEAGARAGEAAWTSGSRAPRGATNLEAPPAPAFPGYRSRRRGRCFLSLATSQLRTDYQHRSVKLKVIYAQRSFGKQHQGQRADGTRARSHLLPDLAAPTPGPGPLASARPALCSVCYTVAAPSARGDPGPENVTPFPRKGARSRNRSSRSSVKRHTQSL